MSSSLKNISDTMDEVFRSINFMQMQMQADPVFSELSFSDALVKNADTYAGFLLFEEIKKSVYSYYLNNSYLYALEVYNPLVNMIFSSKTGETLRILTGPSDERLDAVRGRGLQNANVWLAESGEDGSSRFVKYFMLYYANKPSLVLYAKCTVPDTVLINRVREYYPDTQKLAFAVVEKSGSPFFIVPDPAGFPGRDYSRVKTGKTAFTQKKGGQIFITAAYFSEYAGWSYALTMPLAYFNPSGRLLWNYQYYFAAAILIIFIVGMLFIVSFIIKPLREISRQMRLGENGDLSVRILCPRQDEFGYIAGRFNALMQNIETLVFQNYETKLRKQEFEIKFIQNQLKEHFVYNTLDSIHWIALKHQVPEISHIIFDLSKFFRLTLNRGSDLIPVHQAEAILNSYIGLLNVRMDGLIDFSVTVEPEIRDCCVIKYLFQPLVENAVVHGIQPKQGGLIRVSFKKTAAGKIRFTVEDDGCGIPAEKLADIRLCLEKNSENGAYFALASINRELKLYFNTDYVFFIESVEGEGTRVTVEFPESAAESS